jgi:rubrerythrin
MEIFGGIAAVLWIVLFVLAILTPLMIYLIQRNTHQTRIELRSLNKQMGQLVEVLQKQTAQGAKEQPAKKKELTPGWTEMICPECNKKLGYSSKFSGEVRDCPKCGKKIRLK